MKFFSDIERGPAQRISNEVTTKVWAGLVSYINILTNNGYFAKDFPEECPDGQGCVGTGVKDLKAALLAEIPNLDWPLITEIETKESLSWAREMVPFVPNYLDVMDLIQFCYKHVAIPVKGDYHSYFRHYHFHDFQIEAGREEFREKINTIFARNSLAYELLVSGDIIRMLSPELKQMMENISIPEEKELRSILMRVNEKIINYDVTIRYDGLKEIWDFWERLKSISYPADKKESTKRLLDAAAQASEFRTILEIEAKELTDIGNNYFIRHTEMKQIKIQDSDHIEYLYQRMFSLIYLLLKTLPH
ncbi:TPA: stationary phase or STEss regulating sigma factor [Klebsiella pneumoniae]|nr:stationary phase or STEss regulating sigma factor [Klebsiella pneumoniae]